MEHVHISRSVSKLGADIPSVNLPAGETCRSDAPCLAKCYARHGRFLFSRNKALLERNMRIWQEDPKGFERDVMIAAYCAKFFRWHSSGDIPDRNYLEMMVHIAEVLPDTKFLCFTKKYEMINDFLNDRQLPPNLSIVLSAWGQWQPANPHQLPTSHIRFKNLDSYLPNDAMECSGYCGECVANHECNCWTLPRGLNENGHVSSVVFNEH